MPNPRGRPRYDQADMTAAEAFRRIGERLLLSRDDTRPLWVQLRNGIEEAIVTGSLGPDTRIPSEQGLCTVFGVSRQVVRAALSALASEGRIVKLPRKGIFVAQPRDQVDFMASNLGVFGDLTAKGHVVSTRTFEMLRGQPSARERQVLGLPSGGDVVRIGRVYQSDGQPLTLTHITLPGHRVPGLELMDFENRSVFQTIREQYGLTVQSADRWFSATLPTKEECEKMGVSPMTPLIRIESIAYDQLGAPLEYYQGLYNSSFARIHIAIDPGRALATGPSGPSAEQI